MAGTALRLPRSRGAFSGVLLILLGIWGGLVPLIGPYLHYAYTPDKAWAVTGGRVWLEFLPAAGAVIGGIIMLTSKFRPAAISGATLAGISGAWFAFGGHLTRLLMHNPPVQGSPVGGSFARTIEQLGYFTGLGVVIIGVAAIAVGRLSVISVRDLKLAERSAAADAVPAATRASRTPAPAVSEPGAMTGLPRRRKAPLATLTKMASGKKAVNASEDTETSRPKEEVGSGT